MPVTYKKVPEKPMEGQPCNGCGLCCAMEICRIGKVAFPKAVSPCPAMEFDQGRFFCGLVLTEKKMSGETILADLLGIGKGCDLSD